jgi:hypothetical protein
MKARDLYSIDQWSILGCAYTSALASYERGDAEGVRDILAPAINTFGAAEGEGQALIKPLLLLANATHRLGNAAQAHGFIERALTIARTTHAVRLCHAETLCLVALVEWGNKCFEAAAAAYGRGLEEGTRSGASEEWLAFHETGYTELLLAMDGCASDALTRAAKLFERVKRIGGPDCSQALSARFALARAQLQSGLKAEARASFEKVLAASLRARPAKSASEDGIMAELRGWVARAGGE